MQFAIPSVGNHSPPPPTVRHLSNDEVVTRPSGRRGRRLRRAEPRAGVGGGIGGGGGEEAVKLPFGGQGRGGHEEEGLGVELVAINQVKPSTMTPLGNGI